MAALSLGHSLHRYPHHHHKPRSRTRSSICCRSPGPTRSPDSEEEEEEEVSKKKSITVKKEKEKFLMGLYGEAEKVGRGLKETLSPKQKGDWRDLLLMSFSFAVYVYISQKLVCAYCAWMSMLNHF